MKKLLSLILTAAAVFSLVSCGGIEDEFLDNSFVYLGVGNTEQLSQNFVLKDDGAELRDEGLNPEVNFVLWATFSTAKKDWPEFEVYYDAIPDGLKEGVDYTIKTESKSPLKFVSGNRGVPIRITWIHNTGHEGTLTIKLKGSNLSYLQMGYPGMSASTNKSTFVFTKKSSGN